MDMATVWEWIGYFASGVVVLSLMMSEIKKLRWLNLLGAALFTAYGMVVEAYPVALVNAILVVINLVYLYRIYQQEAAQV